MRTWDPNHRRTKVLERKREAILNGARDEFLASGFEGATMLGIAKRAGVSTATLYRHARTKEDLFAAVVELRVSSDDLQLAMDRLVPLPLEDMLRDLAKGALAALSRTEVVEMQRLAAAEVGRFPALGSLVFDTYHDHFHDTLRRVLALRGITPRNADISEFFVAALGDAELRLLFGRPLDSAGQAARIDRAAQEFAARFRVPPQGRAN